MPDLKAYGVQPSDYAPSRAPVFYNPVMELNRDISVLALQVYQHMVNKEISVCEPLASSGIRGVRYAAEIQNIQKILINDINQMAVDLAKYNVETNQLSERVTVEHKDANCLLSCHGAPHRRFDVVDLDPFGSPVTYLDSAVRALHNKGLLATTATDLAPLCGVHAKACIRKYGGKPLRTEYCHELAVRLLAGCIATIAAKHAIGIHIIFSHSTDHYIRVYTQVEYGAKKADESVKNLGYILHCFSCLHRETTRNPFIENIKCPECGAKMDYAGPLWIGKILDKQFCRQMLNEKAHRAFKNSARITRLLSLVSDEAEAPTTYYVLDKVSAKLTLPVPSMEAMLKALLSNGFQAVITHFNSRGIKTTAPALEMQRILRSIAKRV